MPSGRWRRRILLSHPGGGFNPVSILGSANLGWYYNIGALSGNDGDLLSSVTDLSGNNKTATAVGALRPTLSKAGGALPGGLQTAFFNGGQSLTIPAVDLSGTDNIEMLLVVKYSAGTMIFESASSSTTTNPGYGAVNSAGQVQMNLFGNVGRNTRTTVASYANSWHILSLLFDKSQPATTEVSAFVENAETSYTQSASNNNTNNFGNEGAYIGSRGNTSLFITMYFYAGLLVKRVMTGTERAAIVAGFRGLAGI